MAIEDVDGRVAAHPDDAAELDDAFFDGPRMVPVQAHVDERVVNGLRSHGVEIGACIRDALDARLREVARTAERRAKTDRD